MYRQRKTQFSICLQECCELMCNEAVENHKKICVIQCPEKRLSHVLYCIVHRLHHEPRNVTGDLFKLFCFFDDCQYPPTYSYQMVITKWG